MFYFFGSRNVNFAKIKKFLHIFLKIRTFAPVFEKFINCYLLTHDHECIETHSVYSYVHICHFASCGNRHMAGHNGYGLGNGHELVRWCCTDSGG